MTMNLHEQDLPWLLTEARNDPDTAEQIIAALTGRVQQLQQQSDELRAENVLLKRSGSHRVFQDQVQRLRTDLRDMRVLAEKANLNPDVVTILSFTGHGVHVPAPLPMDQTLTLELQPDESLRDSRPIFMSAATRLDSVLCLTSAFRLVMVNGLSIPISEAMHWKDARAVVPLQRGERVEATCAINELRPPNMLILVTRSGWVRALSWSLVENLVISGQPLTLPTPNDTPVWVGAADEGDLLMLTRNGKWTRFPINAIEASGATGIAMEQDDDVAWGCVIASLDSAVYFVGGDGAQLAVATTGLEAHKKIGGKAASLARKFIALACFTAHKTDALVYLTANADLVVETVRALPIAAKPSEAQPLNVVNQRLFAATKI
jgi:DNA gyrase/topoisomerase IV subunit A